MWDDAARWTSGSPARSRWSPARRRGSAARRPSSCAANCAGVGGGHATTHEYPEEQWRRIVTVNLERTWLTMRREIAAMLQGGNPGSIVKAVCPGAIDTPMMDETFERFPGFRESLVGFVPMGRLGRPDEVASAIAWLVSDAASFVTGEAVAVEGGLLGR